MKETIHTSATPKHLTIAMAGLLLCGLTALPVRATNDSLGTANPGGTGYDQLGITGPQAVRKQAPGQPWPSEMRQRRSSRSANSR